MRISCTPYAPTGKGSALPAIRPEGLSNTLGAFRTLSRTVKDAARYETPFLRVCGVRRGHLLKYDMPVPEAEMSPCNAPKSPQAKQQVPSGQPNTEGSSSKQPETNADPRRARRVVRSAIVAPAAAAGSADRDARPVVPAAACAR